MSSVAGITGVPLRSGYSASKFAMAGFFETIRIELAQYGVSVTMIYPDFVETHTRLEAFGPDGTAVRENKKRVQNAMHVTQASPIIINAISKRKRKLFGRSSR